jgi:phenylalanine-4-hydroxylase
VSVKTYTGEIADDGRGDREEYAATAQEIEFSEEQHRIWAELFSGIQQPHLSEHICHEWHRGMRRLKLAPTLIPTVKHLNDHITPFTGWRVERTVVRYTKADDWYRKFAERVFLVTDYIRTPDQMSFTPEPDMFHDIYGHLPFLTMDFYAKIEDKFAPAYLKATEEEREVIKRLAWYSTEFGIVVEDNRPRIFGAGIISGRAELTNTVMEFYRLDRDDVLDYRLDIYPQICDHFYKNEATIDQIIKGINRLHEAGEMSSADTGWNVVNKLYRELGVDRSGYFGGEVLLAPFTVEAISKIPKTVYAFNPIFFVFESFQQLNEVLDSYLGPIAARD